MSGEHFRVADSMHGVLELSFRVTACAFVYVGMRMWQTVGMDGCQMVTRLLQHMLRSYYHQMSRVAYTMPVHARGCGACDGDDLNDEAVAFQHLHERCYCWRLLFMCGQAWR